MFSVRSPRAVAHTLLAPGQLGLSRAYVSGELDVDDIDDDVSNDFFALFLDDSMTYSCAVFEDPSADDEPLESAQERKLEMVCAKLALRPGERVLDVGCGWGSFPIHAAVRHGVKVVGITLSEPQAALARERADAAGVGDRVEIRVADYREMHGEPFDAIASIGWSSTSAPPSSTATPPMHLSRVLLALERAGFRGEHVEGFAEHYARTLAHWAANLDAGAAAGERLAGAERMRVWRLYLRAARSGFETGFTSIYQVRCRRA